MRKTYLFYDIETTGLNPAFDQVLQFAAIRTDENLTEICRHEFFVRLRADVIPSPHAIITHLMGIKSMEQGEKEVEVIRAIHQLFNEPGTISVGYNTLGFDDEFLRFAFYRNLLTPYTHQYANQCARMDIYPIVIFYYLFSKDILKWPVKNNQLSLKLEELIKANQLAQGQAHNAMVDVLATVELARRLKENNAMWEYCCDYFNKVKELDRLAKWGVLESSTIGLYVDPALGVKNQFISPVLCLGRHRHYKNQWLFLRLDLENLQQTRLDNLTETTWVFRKKMGEPGFLLPTTPRYLEKIASERLAILEANQAWLLSHPSLVQKIAAHYLDYKYPLVPYADVDSVLYQNDFLSSQDELICRRFHASTIDEKITQVSQFTTHELQELAWRLLGRNYFDNLPSDLQQAFKQYVKRALVQNEQHARVDYRNENALSINQASVILDELKKDSALSLEQKNLLDEYAIWLKALGVKHELLVNEIGTERI